MKQLAKAIINVMKDVIGVEKSMKVGSGNYSYKGVSDYEVKKAYKKAMVEHGLCILPIDIDEDTDTHRFVDSNGKQKLSVFTRVKATYLLLHESGESQQIKGYGHGIDSGDKAAGKSTTYAMKYALLYTFMTPTGNIDDSDNTHSDDIPTALPMIDAAQFDAATKAIASTPTPEFKSQYKVWAESFGENTYKTQILELCK